MLCTTTFDDVLITETVPFAASATYILPLSVLCTKLGAGAHPLAQSCGRLMVVACAPEVAVPADMVPSLLAT